MANDPNLNFTQKSRYLALQADDMLPYPELDVQAKGAMESGLICDMFEGHAPFKPRYVMPDYQKAIIQGSEWLELAPPEDLDEAINFLLILFHHVPSVTNIPVFIGRLDQLLSPFIDDSITDKLLHKKIRLMWQMIDRTLPDAFLHVNIGPEDSRIARTILAVDRELKQVVPNLTLRFDPSVTPDSLLQMAVENISLCNKPHIVNEVMNAAEFVTPEDPRGFGIASCYNSLPLGGGAHTLVRINLKKAAESSDGSVENFIERVLPEVSGLTYQIIRARIDYLVNQSNFYQSSFLVKEGLIEQNRFTAMFGIFGLADAVNLLLKRKPDEGYGYCEQAQDLALEIVKTLSDIVKSTELEHCWNNRALFHAQSGISLDNDVSPACRIPYGYEPGTLQHLQTVLPLHKYFTAGISDIFPIDETIEKNPLALMAICKGAFQKGLRMFTANVANNELVRVTGYMVRCSDIKKLKEEGSRLNTTAFGSEAMDNCGINSRNAQIITDDIPWSKRQ
ncbi:YjjI family glycine radical enzyme [Endozoicomonas sp. OPT23]|nr:YjjI family glycine radical enzyme [Endozoicomonas sp. OPT23]